MDSSSFSDKKRTLKPKLLKRLEICVKLGQNNWIIISQTFENQAKVMDCSSFSYFSLFSPARQKKMLRDRFKRSYKVTKIAEQPNLPTTEQPSNRTTELPNYWNQKSSRDHKFAPNLFKSVEKIFSRLLKFKQKWWTLGRFHTKNEPWNQNCSGDLKSVSNLPKTTE